MYKIKKFLHKIKKLTNGNPSHSLYSIYENQFENWTNISNRCKGLCQSPISITKKHSKPASFNFLKEVQFYDKNIACNILVDSALVTFANFGFLSILEKDKEIIYDAFQLHVHVPSEHFVDQNYYDAELHLVFRLRNFENNKEIKNIFTVLGFFYQYSNANNTENEFLNNWIFQKKDIKKDENIEINFKNLEKLLVNNQEFYQYQGSLTTPNCDEVVNWIIFKNPINISFQQKIQLYSLFRNIKNIHSPIGFGNNRKIQDLNERIIHEHFFQPITQKYDNNIIK
jgi:carbonic anhydrase